MGAIARSSALYERLSLADLYSSSPLRKGLAQTSATIDKRATWIGNGSRAPI